MPYDNGLDFTESAFDYMYDAVDDPYFLEKDAELIFETLQSRLKVIPFGDYLKRYIYTKSGLSGRYDDIPLMVYQQILKDSFADRHTPASFSTVSSKLSALSKNWLTQHTVKRKVVLLLGFGLGMTVDDVNEFLKKVLREQGLNFKDPFEILCWYCYENGYDYLKFKQLWNAYEATEPNSLDMKILYSDQTIGFHRAANEIHDEATLLLHVSKLKTTENLSGVSVTARKHYNALYDTARDIVASMYNDTEEERNSREVQEYRKKLSFNTRLYDFEKQKRIEKKVSDKYVFTREDITPGDIESVICAAIPTDRYGNLLPFNNAKIKDHFHGKKFSRQHMMDILKGTDIDRFDLITLNFFIHSQKSDADENSKQRYTHFVDDTNRILSECSMGDLYAANPYECFVLMCILSDDPLGTYADVLELAYETNRP